LDILFPYCFVGIIAFLELDLLESLPLGIG
jgi:hypothetical protein